MPTLNRNMPSSNKQKLSINLIEKAIRKLTGGLVMSSLVLKVCFVLVCFVLCVKSRLIYIRDSVHQMWVKIWKKGTEILCA